MILRSSQLQSLAKCSASVSLAIGQTQARCLRLRACYANALPYYIIPGVPWRDTQGVRRELKRI